MRNIYTILIFLVVALASEDSGRGQVTLKGQLSDFVFPDTDDKGRETVLRGGKARTLPNGMVELTPVTAEQFKDGKLDVTIEAAHCLFDSQNKVAFSDGKLSVKTADGRFLIEGRGFRWLQGESRLRISNEVHAVVRRPFASGNLGLQGGAAPAKEPRTSQLGGSPKAAAGAEESAGAGKEALSQSGPPAGPKVDSQPAQEPIDIVSDEFEFDSEVAVFRRNVRAKQTEGLLQSGLLSVHFAKGGGSVERVEAGQNVYLQQKELESRADRAVYTVATEVVVLTGNASWKAGDREGTGQVITVHSKTGQLEAERDVTVKLKAENVIPMSWFSEGGSTNAAPNAKTNGAGSEGGRLTISADRLAYKPEAAEFKGSVRVADSGGAELSCGLMRNYFTGGGKGLSRIVAEEEVQFKQNDNWVKGTRADYDAEKKIVVLTGDPHWRFDQGTGRSKRVSIWPEEKRMEADGEVAVRLAATASGELQLPIGGKTQTSEAPPQTGEVLTNRFVDVFSDELYYRPGSAIFLNHVRVVELATVERTIRSAVLAAFFGGPGGKLDQLVAEEDVVIEQGVTKARGTKMVYWVGKGWMELTGSNAAGPPEIFTPEQRFRSERFVFDRTQNLFRMTGNYRLEIDRKALRESRAGSEQLP